MNTATIETQKKSAASVATGSMPGFKGVHHSARPTWKLRETIEFYRDIMGLPLVHTISARGWGRPGHPDFLHFFFDSGLGSTIAFFYYIGTDRPDFLAPRIEDWMYRATHTAWRVETRDELVAWKEKLEAKGQQVSVFTQHEVIDSIYLTDPNGYPVEITLQTREFEPKDSHDAALTMQAAVDLIEEAAAKGERVKDIDTIWRRKAEMVSKLPRS